MGWVEGVEVYISGRENCPCKVQSLEKLRLVRESTRNSLKLRNRAMDWRKERKC